MVNDFITITCFECYQRGDAYLAKNQSVTCARIVKIIDREMIFFLEIFRLWLNYGVDKDEIFRLSSEKWLVLYAEAAIF